MSEHGPTVEGERRPGNDAPEMNGWDTRRRGGDARDTADAALHPPALPPASLSEESGQNVVEARSDRPQPRSEDLVTHPITGHRLPGHDAREYLMDPDVGRNVKGGGMRGRGQGLQPAQGQAVVGDRGEVERRGRQARRSRGAASERSPGEVCVCVCGGGGPVHRHCTCAWTN